jgi:tetratricopeptide (TPR) repeat protein
MGPLRGLHAERMASEMAGKKIEGVQLDRQTAFRVLVIVSRPLDVEELPELADSWAITYGLTQVEAPVYIKFLKPATLEELAVALAQHWDIIHFDGHAEEGQERSVLVFEDETGLAERVPGHRIAELLSKQPPRLCILSACGTAVGEDLGLAGEFNSVGVPACIGTVESVTTAWTQKFMRALYAMLGAGNSIRDAFDQAVRAVEGGIYAGDFQVPVLVGEGNITLCDSGWRGEPIILSPKLINWTRAWHGEFQGEYIDRDDSDQPIYPPIGRKGYVIRVIRALTSGERLIFITGLGGIGKSVIAAFSARRIAWKFPGGVFWVDGRDYLDSQIPFEALLDQFSIIFGEDYLSLPTSQKLQRVRLYLEQPNRGCLFVIDNSERISTELARFVSQLPDASAALLTTPQAPAYGGVVISLPPMEEQESLSLLNAEIERRRNQSLGEQVDSEDETGELIEIIELLDNHPLALLHAAALVVKEGLERTLGLVREHPAQGKETHERFDFSYVVLTDPQRALLHRLASFPSRFDEQAVRAICLNEDLTSDPLPDWEADLRALRDLSFVELYDLDFIQQGYRRFRLHPVMRDYVRTKISQIASAAFSTEGKQLLENQDYNVARYFLGMIHFLADHLNNTETAMRAVLTARIERHNLLGAQRISIEQNRMEDVVDFCHLLDQLFRRSGDWTMRKQAIEAGLKMAEEVGNQLEIGARLHNLAIVAMDMGDLAEAKDLCLRSIQVSNEIEGQVGRQAVAKSVQLLGTIAFQARRVDKARQLWQQSLELSEEVSDQEIVALSHLGLGMVEIANQNSRQAEERLTKALGLCRELDKKDQVAGVLQQLGIAAYSAGDYVAAREALEEALRMNEALADLEGLAKALAQLALVDKEEGKLQDALDRTEQAEQLFLILGNQSNINLVKKQWRNIRGEADQPPDSV